MDYCFRLVLAAGFLALPISLFAGEHGTVRQEIESKAKDYKQSHPEWTQEQKDQFKAAVKKMGGKQKEPHKPMQTKLQQAKLQQSKEEMKAKLENWKQNHPQELPGNPYGDQRKPQFTGGPKRPGGSVAGFGGKK